ncbi:hypothetical protein Z043_107677, partial [Scleropages formosus]
SEQTFVKLFLDGYSNLERKLQQKPRAAWSCQENMSILPLRHHSGQDKRSEAASYCWMLKDPIQGSNTEVPPTSTLVITPTTGTGDVTTLENLMTDHFRSYPQPNSAEAKELRGLISCWDGSSVTCRNQIEHFMKMGIPPVLRGRVWRCLLDIDTLRATSKFCYQKCLREVREPLVDLGFNEYSVLSAIAMLNDAHDQNPFWLLQACSVSTDDLVILHQIALDLRRSFPTHRSLMGDTPEAIEGQAKLFRVLVAYARYNPKIGYSQGMSHIGAVLLMNLPEEEAFWALVALLESPKYLSGLFDHSLDKIQHQVGVFHQLLKHRSPRLFQHIVSTTTGVLHVTGMLALFRVGLTIIHLLEPQLLRMKDEALVLPLLLHVPVDVAQHCILIPALWNTEVQEWEVICMNSLILEEAGDGSCHLGQVAESPSAIKTRSRKKLDLEEGLKEAAAGRAKSAKTDVSIPPGSWEEMGTLCTVYLAHRLHWIPTLGRVVFPQPDDVTGLEPMIVRKEPG